MQSYIPNNNLNSSLLFNLHPNSSTSISSPALEAYFLLVVLSYYLQQQRISAGEDEFEVLYRASEAQLATNP